MIVAFGAPLLVAMCSIQAMATVLPRVHGFVPNEGQWPSEVLFLSRSHGLNVWVTRTGMVFDQYRMVDRQREGHVLRLSWTNGRALSAPVSVDRSSMQVSMFGAGDQWHTAMPVMNGMRFDDVWEGIDLIYYLDADGNVRYDFDVQPGASLQEVGFAVQGDLGMTIEPTDVTLKTSVGSVSMGDLFAYVLGRKSMQTQALFSAASNGVSFRVPQWTGSVPLRVDPVVSGTFVGGQSDADVLAVRTVSDGVIVAGWTSGIDFPTEVGAYRSDMFGARDVFVAKFTFDLSEVLAYTYYGGGKDDLLTAMDVDQDGNIYITGETLSSNLPTSIGAVGQAYVADIDAFIASFTPDLKTLRYSTYIGGNKDEKPRAIVCYTDGSVYVAGGTTSNASFPVKVAHQSTLGGQEDGFLLRLNATGGTLLFCTYYGKSGIESFQGLAVDNSGSPFVTGATSSSDFETAPTPGRWGSRTRLPYDRTYNDGPTDAFLIKFFPDGTLSKADDGTFSTFFGGRGADAGRGVFVDDLGRPTVVGVTNSDNIPADGGLNANAIGGQDIFIVTFTDDGRGITGCTYFGGTNDDDVRGIIADPFRNATMMFGSTQSGDFPVAGVGTNTTRRGVSDGFIAAVNTASNQYITLVGGVGPDEIISAHTDALGDYYYVLESESPDLYTGRTSWMRTQPEGTSGYVGKWSDGDIVLSSPSGGEVWCKGSTRGISWSAIAMRSDDRYTVELSNDGGVTWTEVAKNLTSTSYQWQIPAGLSTDGEYIARVRSGRGHATESKTFLLAEPPSITTQPMNVGGCAGSAVELRVEAAGAQLRYQWRKNGQNITGATSAVYQIPALSAGNVGSYDVIVTGSCNPNVTSSAVTVQVDPATAVTKQPENVTVDTGKEIVLSVTAAGGNLSYQWMKDGSEIAGATEATYRITAAGESDAGSYTCAIAGTCGEVTSQAATVEVRPATSVLEDVVADCSLRVLGPTPSSSVVNIELSAPRSTMATVRLVDLHGSATALVQGLEVAGGVQTMALDVTSVVSGAYGLEIILDGRVLRGMLLIER